MSFELWRVEADYIPQRGDVVGPGWICQTAEQANELALSLEGRKDLTNISIRHRVYGGDNK